MTDRHALLAAVLADPDADAPRLVYADYLEEHGDDAGADLIRHQCGYYRTHQDDMLARLDGLLAATAADRPAWDGIDVGPPVRGFPCDVTFRTPAAFDHWPDVFARLPVTSVRIDPVAVAEPDSAGRLAAVLAPGRIRLLDLSDVHPLADQLPGLLAAAPPGSLRAFVCRNGRLSDRHAAAIAAARSLVGLEELCLGGNRIADSGAEAILESPHLRRLRFLDVFANPLEHSRSRLRARFGPEVWL